MTGSDVVKIAAVTAGSEIYEISRESGSMTLLQVRPGMHSLRRIDCISGPIGPNCIPLSSPEQILRIIVVI